MTHGGLLHTNTCVVPRGPAPRRPVHVLAVRFPLRCYQRQLELLHATSFRGHSRPLGTRLGPPRGHSMSISCLLTTTRCYSLQATRASGRHDCWCLFDVSTLWILHVTSCFSEIDSHTLCERAHLSEERAYSRALSLSMGICPRLLQYVVDKPVPESTTWARRQFGTPCEQPFRKQPQKKPFCLSIQRSVRTDGSRSAASCSSVE